MPSTTCGLGPVSPSVYCRSIGAVRQRRTTGPRDYPPTLKLRRGRLDNRTCRYPNGHLLRSWAIVPLYCLRSHVPMRITRCVTKFVVWSSKLGLAERPTLPQLRDRTCELISIAGTYSTHSMRLGTRFPIRILPEEILVPARGKNWFG